MSLPRVKAPSVVAGDPAIEALCLEGDNAGERGDWRDALRWYQEVLWTCGARPASAGLRSAVYVRIGDLHLHAAMEPEIARGYYEAAIRCATDDDERVRVMCRLAETYRRSPRALQCLEDAARLAAKTGHGGLRRWVEFRRAEEIALPTPTHRRRLISLGCEVLADLTIPDDWRESARGQVITCAAEVADVDLLDEHSRQLGQRTDSSWGAARHHYAVADGLRMVGRLEEAIAHAGQAAAIYRDLGRKAEETGVHLAIADFSLARGDVAIARDHCRWVLDHGEGKTFGCHALGILCQTGLQDESPQALSWAHRYTTCLVSNSEAADEGGRPCLHEVGAAERLMGSEAFARVVRETADSSPLLPWLPSPVDSPPTPPPARLLDWSAEAGSDTGSAHRHRHGALLESSPYRGFARLDVPRLTRRAQGNFALEATIHGGGAVLADIRRCRCEAGHGVVSASAVGAGGLLLLRDPRNSLRLFAHVRCPGEVLAEARIDGRRQALGRALLGDGPLRLRIDRQGSGFLLMAAGQDGWCCVGEVGLPSWDDVEIGVYGECPTDLYSIVRRCVTRFSGIGFSGEEGASRSRPVSLRLAPRPEPRSTGPGGMLVGSPAMARAIERSQRFAPDRSPVLIVGETGTGKELVARAIHEAGPRRAKPFIALNCAALPRDLMERELFGHLRGAFTGAHATRGGLFEAADSGTLFLDEISKASDDLQVRLLRIVEEQAIRPVGGARSRPVDVRLISATNDDLSVACAEGRFRTDLYYRLRGATVRLPPLRERPEDIPLLAYHALDLWGRARGQLHPGITIDAMELLSRHRWPGNVRELIHEVQEAAALVPEAPIRPSDLSVYDLASAVERRPDSSPPARLLLLTEALRRAGGNVSHAARELGISRSTMYRWLRDVCMR